MILYILVSDGGDGSYYPRFILDKSVLDEIETLVDSDVWDYENGFGCDGDGFNYTELTVPDGSTPASLGLSEYSVFTAEDLVDWKKCYIDDDE